MKAIVLALVAIATMSGASSHRSSSARPIPDYRITNLRAHLFYSDKGSLSPNVLGRSGVALWNTVIGEGDAGGASSSTLIVVEVGGEPGSHAPGRQVEVAVRTDRREILRRRADLSVLNDAGHTYVAFWLDDTGCEPLRISTALLGQRNASRRVADLPFHCGE